MDRNRCVFVSAFVLAAVAACGGSSRGSTSGTTTSDITEYQGLALSVQSAATTYGTTMVGPDVADINCQSVHDQYDSQVRPWVSRLVQMSGEMDALIKGQGDAPSADMSCGSATILDELDFHQAVACTLSSLSANKEEAARHADAVNSFTSHVLERSREMLGGTNRNRWAPMMSGCERWASTCCNETMRSGCCGGLLGLDGMTNGETCCGAGP